VDAGCLHPKVYRKRSSGGCRKVLVTLRQFIETFKVGLLLIEKSTLLIKTV